MALLPLTLSAHPNGWRNLATFASDSLAESVFRHDGWTCRFCGLRSTTYQEVFHLDGDHSRSLPTNLVTACPLCHACQHFGRDTIVQEFSLAWLPEMSQAALNHLVRMTHLVFFAHGEEPSLSERPRKDSVALRSAYRTYHALSERVEQAKARLGSTSPRELGEALLGMPPTNRREALVGGMRLLSRGRFFVDGDDIYPMMLHAWSEEGGHYHTAFQQIPT